MNDFNVLILKDKMFLNFRDNAYVFNSALLLNVNMEQRNAEPELCNTFGGEIQKLSKAPSNINLKLEFISANYECRVNQKYDFENILGEFVDSKELIKAIYNKKF